MKFCPKCKSSFTDETLKFCLQDGTQLITLSNESSSQQHTTDSNRDAPTLQMHQFAKTEEMTDDEETVERKQRISQQTIPQPAQPQPRKGNIILTLGVIVIALCLVALVLLGAAFLAKDFLFPNKNNANNNTPNTNNANTGKSPTPTPTPANQYKISASSTRAPYNGITYNPSFLIDENLSTAWIEGASGEGIGESVRCDFGKTVTLKKIIVYPGYFKGESTWGKNNRLAAVTFYFSDGSSLEANFDDEMKPQTVDVGKIKTTYVKLVIGDVYAGETDFEDTAVSEISFVFE